jgi:hypothetical protein
MKKTRFVAMLLAVVTLLALTVSAVNFVPSIERKDCPDLLEYEPEGDILVVTPLSEAIHGDGGLHEDIGDNLLKAYEELGENDWMELVLSFALEWDEFTGGAPLTNAVVTDIFDARFASELGANLTDGKAVTFKIKVQGITTDDTFMIIAKPEDEDTWQIIEYTINENNVITITAESMSAFAIVFDNEADPATDPIDGPQTGVAKNSPVIYVAVVFAIAAIGCVAMLLKKRKA